MKTYTIYNKATGLPILKGVSLEDARHLMTKHMGIREECNMKKRYGNGRP